MKWEFILQGGLVSKTLKAEVIYTGYQIEEIKVTGDGISIIAQSNRPLLMAIERNYPITWKLIQGEIKGDADFNRITKELEKHLLQQDKTAPSKNASIAFSPVKISA